MMCDKLVLSWSVSRKVLKSFEKIAIGQTIAGTVSLLCWSFYRPAVPLTYTPLLTS